MRRLLIVAAAAFMFIGAFAAPASANPDRPGPPPPDVTTTTVITTTTLPQTTVPPTTEAPQPTVVPTTAPPTTIVTRVPPTTAAPEPTVPRTTGVPEPTMPPTTVAPAQPSVTAVVDCVQGIVFTGTNPGGQSATVTLTVDGNIVGELNIPAGGTETYVFDLNPADAGTSKVVQAFYGDVALFDQVLEVKCGEFAATPCASITPTAGTPAITTTTTDSGCSNPCWWAPAALAFGVLIGRRRRNGHINPVGIGAGVAGVFFALIGFGAVLAAWAALIAAAIATAIMLRRRARKATTADTEASAPSEPAEAPAEASKS